MDLLGTLQRHIIHLKRLRHLSHLTQTLTQHSAGVLLESIIAKENPRLERLIDQLHKVVALLVEEVFFAHGAELHFEGLALGGKFADFVRVVDVLGGDLLAGGLAHFACQVAQLGFLNVFATTVTQHILFPQLPVLELFLQPVVGLFQLLNRVDHLPHRTHQGVIHELHPSAEFLQVEHFDVLKQAAQSNFQLVVVLSDFLFHGEAEIGDFVNAEI